MPWRPLSIPLTTWALYLSSSRASLIKGSMRSPTPISGSPASSRFQNKATHPGIGVSPIISLSELIKLNGFRELKLAKPAWTEKAFHSNPWWSLPQSITRDTSCQVCFASLVTCQHILKARNYLELILVKDISIPFGDCSWRQVDAQCRAQLQGDEQGHEQDRADASSIRW